MSKFSFRDALDGDGVPGRAETSQIAAIGNRKYQRVAVLAALLDLGPSTAAEVTERVNDDGASISKNQIATRLGELRKDRLVRKVMGDNGRVLTRPTDTGKPAWVQEITNLGVLVLKDVLTDD